MLKDVKKILEIAVWAPSGDNSQPWEFKIDSKTIRVFNTPERDNPYLNYRQSGSYLANGCLIENICIAGRHFGYEPKLSLFPDCSEENLIAIIELEKKHNIKDDELFEYITKRHTNRKVYKKKVLEQKQEESLKKISEDFFSSRVIFEKEPRKKIELARAGSSAEIVILENKMLHNYFFREIIWSFREEIKKKTGLFINTMKLNPIQKFLFFLAHYWILMKIAIKLKLPIFIAKEDSKLYSTGAAIGSVVLRNNSRESFVEAGRLMQRLWLKATQLNLSLQPITPTLFLGRRVLSQDAEDLSGRHKKLISKAYKNICEIFEVEKNEIPVIMFRIGYADPVSARCSRINHAEKIVI